VSKPSLGMFAFSIWILAVSGLAALAVVGAGGWHRRPTTANGAATAQPATSARQTTRVLASMGSIPLAFEANRGQTNPQVKFMARGNGYTVFLTAHDTVFALHSSSLPATRFTHRAGTTQATQDRTAAIHMRLLGGNPDSPVTASDQLPSRSNYFIGNDRRQWHTNVPQYERVSYREAYPGVSLAYYGVQKQLEFDFIVAPSASPAPIRLGISGANRISTDNSGNLILASSAGNVLLHKPVAYQPKDGARQPVEARFILQAHNQVSFALGNYDRSHELVIDPSVSYATYIGGTAEDDGNAIAVDANGNAWVTGQTKSTDFPPKTPLYTTNKGGFDVFVSKFSSGGALLFSTYIGGSSDDSGNAIVIDPSGDAFVAGGTKSSNFPIKGAYQSTLKGAINAFVLEVNSSGSTLVYSTYLGGTGTDVASGIALDKNGNAYVAGSTTSTDFPPKNPLAGETSGGFVTELNSSGNALIYSTYLGAGSLDFASAVAVDGSGNAYVTGGTESPSFVTTAGVVQPKCGTDGNCNGALYDAFVTEIKPLAAGLVYSTFLGGESRDEGLGIAVDGSGNAYVTGVTTSTQFPLGVARLFPTLQGSSDAFVSELNPAGTQLVNSTYLGGSGADVGLAIAVDKNQNAYITGVTGSTNFPTANPTQAKNNGQNDAFVAEFATGGASLVFSTYLGGSLNENTSTASASGGSLAGIAVDSTGANIYVTGSTSSTDFPTVTPEQPQAGGNGSSNGDAFVVKYSSSGTGANFTISNGALNPTSGHPGASASATITVTSQNGFAGTVALACTVAPAVAKGPTCSFSNASVTLTANGSATSTLNLATTTASARLDRPSTRRSSGIFYASLLPLGITLLGAGFGSSGARRRKLFGFLMLGLLLAALLLLPACSSSSGGGGGSGTPTGTYTITVTGTSGSAVVTGAPALSFTVN
jgi:beta-propeller repeat-containing protein